MLKRVATKIAHSRTLSSLSPAANVSLRSLQDLITAEKLVLSSLDKLSVDVSKAAEALHLWGVCEGDDLSVRT
ncbi:hypothetical protein B0H14DRAFT_2392987 [Mycena olivaceomarginata]|nr:hypothetical protein B0H14DRAFT_2392987 [Mycena olivaceomarginata]